MNETLSPSQESIKLQQAREEVRQKISRIFDDKELDKRLIQLVQQVDLWRTSNVISEVEANKIIETATEAKLTQDKDIFVAKFLEALAPIIKIKITNPEIFERIVREQTIENNIGLSEVLYASIEDDNNIYIHLPPVIEFIKTHGLQHFEKEVLKGLHNLAEILKEKTEVKEVWAISHVVTNNPKRFSQLGFKIVGTLTKEEQARDFPEAKVPVTKAFMPREEFIAKYS